MEIGLSTYDYFKDTYGSTYGSTYPPRLGIAGGRRTIEMNANNCVPLHAEGRLKSDYNERIFELQSVGVGGAIEFEMQRIKKEARRDQVREKILFKH